MIIIRFKFMVRLIQIFVQIHKDQLAYANNINGTKEYVGELYHMNVSCFGGGLPESATGCLFFKVGGNTSTVVGKNHCMYVKTCTAQFYKNHFEILR